MVHYLSTGAELEQSKGFEVPHEPLLGECLKVHSPTP